MSSGRKTGVMLAGVALLAAIAFLFSRRAGASEVSTAPADILPATPGGGGGGGGAIGNLNPGQPAALPASIAPIAFNDKVLPGGTGAKQAPPLQEIPQPTPAPRQGGGDRPNISYGVEQTHAF